MGYSITGMKIGTITQPNKKGQIVIPKEYRDRLGINDTTPLNVVLKGNAIYLYPVEEILTAAESESSYVKVLEKTQGKWAGVEEHTKNKRALELKASKKRKRAW